MLVALQPENTVACVPPKLTVLLPWLAPKFVPVIVTVVPTAPLVGDTLVIEGAEVTVKFTPLLGTPDTVTTTFPVLAPAGTVTPMLVALQPDNTVACVPPKLTVLLPWLAPKFVPVIVTVVPTAPLVGDTLLIEGAEVTVKFTPLLGTPDTVTTTFPVTASAGTVTPILVALQPENTVACVPPKLTVLLPWLAPKFVPVIVTVVPTAPLVGDTLVIVGVGDGITVKVTPLLGTPKTVTTTFPVLAPAGTVTPMLVALQPENTVACVPPKLTVLLPWLAPKFVPVIVTVVPTAPLVGDTLVIVGVGGGVTVKLTPVLGTPDTVTTTFPVLAPAGTVTPMLVALQPENTVACVPPKLTVLLPWLAPKFVPVIVTVVPTAPLVGDTLLIEGVERTVKFTPLLGTPDTVTTTFPVLAPAGTVTPMLVALQPENTVACVPPKLTVLLPWLAPKFVPVIVTV